MADASENANPLKNEENTKTETGKDEIDSPTSSIPTSRWRHTYILVESARLCATSYTVVDNIVGNLNGNVDFAICFRSKWRQAKKPLHPTLSGNQPQVQSGVGGARTRARSAIPTPRSRKEDDEVEMEFSANTPTYRGPPALVFQFSRLVGRPPNPPGERDVVLKTEGSDESVFGILNTAIKRSRKASVLPAVDTKPTSRAIRERLQDAPDHSVSEVMASPENEKPTTRAIKERLFKMRQIVKTPGSKGTCWRRCLRPDGPTLIRRTID
ncbi:uncharacterized protein CDV56_104533 [Aspergillus thermomutatus]|uniref:Uncharacterized protein n=1 Tax=Aspergillus thermomutatus TaxID=41047 RepID=A0A397GPC8_ASPTH|nr:uncharacterized protein CDV56_104533 [Aspergillus thermomutatus]RHZ51558.1 hypothetical protein CDV56_104533 [Aspergillus thermomutatus]